MVGASILVLASGGQAFAQAAQSGEAQVVETVVVTGSRIISIAANSPTPVTTISKDQLASTTPSNIPDALNKLPVFQGSQQPRRSGDGSNNLASNVLSLRGFGAQRTLVLLDGHRATPSNANGTVDVDTLPQMLVSRVDVVTGGASAVYGSDAVTGVVNFILDKKFTGLKLDANAGISDYGDGASYKVGAAAGRDLFGGRGHIIVSAEHRYQDDVRNFDRPYGAPMYVLTGAGTAANPFTSTINTRRGDSSFGGLINSCTGGCAALGQQFISNGVLGPFAPGVKTGTGNQNSGGDGAYSVFTTALVAMRNDEAFARFSYDLSDTTNFHIQASYAEAFSKGYHFPVKLTPGATQASNFFKNNPFLSPTVQAQLGNNGLSNSSNMFGMGTYIVNTGPEGLTGTRNLNRNGSVSAGLDGTFKGRFRWDLFYTHGENRLRVEGLTNSNYQKQFAALDAVAGPNGTIQCYAATQAATAAAYAGCVPLNAFGPTAITPEAFAWFTQTTVFHMNNILDNVGGSIAGPAFNNWAGPVEIALSAEARFNKYTVTSNASPTATVDCTGLRICNPALPLWAQPVSAAVDAKNNVWEVAGEVGIPLLKDVPFVKSLDANLAGRYTDYSTSGAVQTWKVGLDYHVSDDFRFRGTTSLDIRAPTLNDLFQPVQNSVSGFVDLHTATSNTVFFSTKGNPDLKPEKARTYTFGAVWAPEFLSGFMASLDYYKIRMNNAIGSVSAGNNSVQKLCEDSGGSSPYCSLFVRPLPFSDHSPANFPTKVFSQSLNTALTQVEGYDFEANYRFRQWGGAWSARLLANYQPTNESRAFPGAAIVRVAAPKTRITGFLRYDLNDWSFGAQDRWLSGYSQVTQDGQVWTDPHVRSFNVVDLNLEKKFKLRGADVSAYVTVQNAFNSRPAIVPTAGSIGIFYPVPPGEDIMGRYFTIGLHAKM